MSIKSKLLELSAFAALGEAMMNAPAPRFKQERPKTPLTPKQRKNRAKSKAGRKARKINR